MKKIFSLIILCFFMFGFIPKDIFASDTGYFIVTAYYSPLPDQNYYITGNYESEKRLNGNGIAGASGKKVFSGMLAAPGKYAFGTKIQLDGLGIGSVDDRGGAIVPAGERGYGHDRIDVWVGYGDEGLRRAMYWGKRKVSGKVISNDTQITLDYNSIAAPTWAVPKTTLLYGNTVQVDQNYVVTQNKVLDIFSLSLGKGSDSQYIKDLQNILQEVGYYTPAEFTGVYDEETINAVFNFQISNDIINNEQTIGAGSYGPKTRKKLKEMYEKYLEEKKIREEQQFAITQFEKESIVLASQKIELLGTPSYGEISPEVREVQKMLAKLGYFNYKDTAIFGVKTQNALLDFQLEHDIIESNNDLGAGVFGPKTKEYLTTKVGELYFKEVLELEGLLEFYNSTILEEENIIDEIKEEIATESISYSI